ncbi:hypothetical protein [Mesoflavibacter sp. CH_XMU1404-2]|uniref:hypothetical protein n=1 Tax=Mesoflavibacter sp. CH_XMU1404-2 TaxID=3107766 RepID=UPI00300B1C5E
MKPEKVFKANPSLKAYFETSDGTKFFTENNAKNHAKSLENKAVKKVERGAVVSSDNKQKSNTADKSSKKASTEERIAAINALDTVEAVTEALKGETAKTVKAAGAEKIKALEASAAGSTDDGSTSEDVNDNK